MFLSNKKNVLQDPVPTLQQMLAHGNYVAQTRSEQEDSPEDIRKFLFTEDATCSDRYGRPDMSLYVRKCLDKEIDINTLIGYYLRKSLNLRYIETISPKLSRYFLSPLLVWCLRETAPETAPVRSAEKSVSPLDHSKIEPLMRQLEKVDDSFNALVQDAIHLFDDTEWSSSTNFRAFGFARDFRKCKQMRLCMLAEYPQYLKLEKCRAHHTDTKYLVKL
jgi:hypothetical protein